MILVDRRIGSKDLLKPLQKLGLDSMLTELEFGDIAFEGRGPNNSEVAIGIELKVLSDLINSLRSGRLVGHQLPGLLTTYDHYFLVVEGMWKSDAHGGLCSYEGPKRGWRPVRGRMTTNELEKTLLTLEMKAGLHVRFTPSRGATLSYLSSLYHWWTDSAFDSHRSHLAIHTPHTFLQISDFRTTVSTFPGIGIKASLAVERHFGGSLMEAVTSDADDWASIETVDDTGKTRRIGMKTAVKVVKFFRGDK